MPDIKARSVAQTIKTSHRSVKSFSKDVRESDRTIKGAVDSSGVTNDSDASPDSYPAEVLQYTETAMLSRGGSVAGKILMRSAKEPFRVGQRHKLQSQIKSTKASIKEAKQTIKQSSQTIKTAIKGVGKGAQTTSAAVHTTSQTAPAAGKATQSAAQANIKAANTAARAAQESVKAAAQAARAIGKVAIEVGKAIVAALEELIGALAAGGWIVVVVVLIIAVLVALIAVLLNVDTEDNTHSSLQDIQYEVAATFSEQLDADTAGMDGYDKVAVRPAPQITDWNNIIAVYTIRAQHNGLLPFEITEDNKALLQQTLLDMVSFVSSVENLSYVQTMADGSQTSHAAKIGVITVRYKTPEEMAALYGFSADERELLSTIVSEHFYSDRLPTSNGGSFKSPCPSGLFFDDFPAKAGSTVYHPGRDISAYIGAPILAAAEGTVTHINDMPGVSGGHIAIQHADGHTTVYAHCDLISVSVGQTVEAGQQIAVVSEPPEGGEASPHLHFEIRNGDNIFTNTEDPLLFLR